MAPHTVGLVILSQKFCRTSDAIQSKLLIPELCPLHYLAAAGILLSHHVRPESQQFA